MDEMTEKTQNSDEIRLLQKAIRRIVRANDLHSRALAKATGLTTPQLVILAGVRELGEVTTAALSAHADLSPATVVTVLDNLEERGLVERYRSTLDRRIVHTRLTRQGRALLERAPGPLDTGFLARFRALPAGRRRAVLLGIAEIADMMQAAEAGSGRLAGTPAPQFTPAADGGRRPR